MDKVTKFLEGLAQQSLCRDYVPCSWCGGGSASGPGCMSCSDARAAKIKELDAEYARQFPNGPQPIATFRIPEDMDAAKRAIGREAIEKAFRPGGGGVQEIIDNCAKEGNERTT